jgi:hypothetical protein
VTALSHSRRLRATIGKALPELATAAGAVVGSERFRELYVDFAVAVHQMIRASVPLMRAAHDRAVELAGSDPVAAAMVPYLAHHVTEELHHDDWLLEDVEGLGVPRERVLAAMPGSAVASMIGAHYYWIRHHHPVAQLGQIAVMEGYPSPLSLIDAMVERTGYPREAFRTFEMHCRLDPRHRDELDEALDAMPLTDAHHEVLAVSALHTLRAAARVWREVAGRLVMPPARPDLRVTPTGDGAALQVRLAGASATHRVGEQEGFLLQRCDGRQSREEVRRAFVERFDERLSRGDLDAFLSLARAESWLLDEDSAPPAAPSLARVPAVRLRARRRRAI